MTPWTVASQAPPSIEFSRQEYWSGLLCPTPGGLLDPGTEPGSLTLQVDSGSHSFALLSTHFIVMLKKLKLNGSLKTYKTF